MAHCPYVDELAACPEGWGELITPLYEDFIEGPFEEVFKEAILEINCIEKRVVSKEEMFVVWSL
jgi:hypothetical protein